MRAPSHTHAKTMPIGIEDPMQLKERHDARARRKWQELNERREVLGAQVFCRERCVVGRRRRSPVGREMFVGEAVWRASMVLRDVQNSPKSEFCSIFQCASMLQHVGGDLYGRKGEDEPRIPLPLRRPSVPIALLLSARRAHQGVPSCCSLISPSLLSDGTLGWRVLVGPCRGPAGRAYSAESERQPQLGEESKIVSRLYIGGTAMEARRPDKGCTKL
jgi:hypothetical protein